MIKPEKKIFELQNMIQKLRIELRDIKKQKAELDKREHEIQQKLSKILKEIGNW